MEMFNLLALRNEKKAPLLASIYSLLPMAVFMVTYFLTGVNLKVHAEWMLYALGVAVISALPLLYLWYRAYWLEKYKYKIHYNDNVLLLDLMVVVAFLLFVLWASGGHMIVL